jgi:dipeptidase E
MNRKKKEHVFDVENLLIRGLFLPKLTSNMGKIVALGGGEMGRPGTKKETIPIDREIIRLTGKKHPKLLFLPTASGDALSSIEVVKKYFGDFLGCRVSSLLLLKERLSHTAIRTKILGSDIVYVGGGTTLQMMRIWRKQGVDKVLQLAYKKGIVFVGLRIGRFIGFFMGTVIPAHLKTLQLRLST